MKEPKFIRLIPDHGIPMYIHEHIAMPIHMMDTSKSMTVREVQAALFDYYKDNNDVYDTGECGLDVVEVSLKYITAALYLACKYDCAKLVEE